MERKLRRGGREQRIGKEKEEEEKDSQKKKRRMKDAEKEEIGSSEG